MLNHEVTRVGSRLRTTSDQAVYSVIQDRLDMASQLEGAQPLEITLLRVSLISGCSVPPR